MHRNKEPASTHHAQVDDERSHKQESKTESASGAEYHQHVEKIVQKHPGADAEHVSTVEPSIARKEYQELRLLKPDGFLRSLHHHAASSADNWNVLHSDRELSLGHRQNMNRKDCWNFGCMVTGTWWHPGWGEGMPSPSPRRPSPKRKREKSVTTDTGIPVTVPDPFLLSPLANPDDLDARRRLPHGLFRASVQVLPVAASRNCTHSSESKGSPARTIC